MSEDQKKYMREYMKAWQAERKAKGLCVCCGEPSDGKRKCQRCRDRDNANARERLKKREEAGLCKGCGEKFTGVGKVYCEQCLARAGAANREQLTKKRQEGRCISCGQSCEKTRCKVCNGKSNAKIMAARKQRLVEGKCRDCGAEAITTTRSLRGKDRAGYCRDCYLKMLARMTLGSGKLWKVLLDKLEACNWTCPYTGEKLILGDNLSFDHKNPVKRFPEQKHDPDNIEPCTWQINLMKRDLTKEEFLAAILKIAGNIRQRVG